MNGLVALMLIVVLLTANAFFVGAEFALISSRRDRLEALLDRGVSRAKIVINASKDVSRMLAGAQLGITICSLLLLIVGEPAVAGQLAAAFGLVGLAVPTYVVHAVAFTVALALMTALHVLIGEMVPKNLAIAEPEKLAQWLVPVLVAWTKVAAPFIGLLNFLANSMLRLAGITPKNELETAYTSHELAQLLSESRREGLIEQSEHRRLNQALASIGKTVRDVLVPRDQLTTLSDKATVGDVEQAVSTTGFSRFPVRSGAGELVGYIHVKDVLDQANQDPTTVVPAEKLRRLTSLATTAHLEHALSAMRAEGSHLAAAMEGNGDTVGVVALEDLVEEYVGTVRDGMHVDNGNGRL